MLPQKKILVVEDNLLNREMLVDILADYYLVLEAGNGQEALEILKEHQDDIALILLDIVMPVMDGFTCLDSIKKDSELSLIPVIVMTQSENENDEVAALTHGATDFVPKPYRAQVILHRVASIIKLRETAAMVNQFKYDRLTGLYSREFFYQQVQKCLWDNPDKEYDLVCSNIENFKLYNDAFGVPAGDRLLKDIADVFQKEVGESGICGRFDADRFICLQNRTDENKDWDLLIKKYQEAPLDNMKNVVMKWGIYEIKDRTVPVEQMCDRALLAVNSIKGQYNNYFAVYDDSLRSKLLREQAITNVMETALDEEQFSIHFQPKYNLKDDSMAGSEALVRWIHPQMGFLSPGEFIPLFEKNGFITRMDHYVWEKTCSYLKNWKEKGYPILPVSVNVSRADVYQPDLPETLYNIVKKYDLNPSYLHLEITESSYMEDPEQLISTVEKLRKLGFIIEMDDFGSGYSSLNMLNQMKLDILKLDMKFIQSETAKPLDKGILKFIVELARWMNLSVVAEGVETRAQLERLRILGCDYVQGYFFSRPLPAEEFEELLKLQPNRPLPDLIKTSRYESAVPQLLIIDEDEKYKEKVQDIFNGIYQVEKASDPDTALKYMEQSDTSISLVMLSVSLPEDGAARFMRIIRQNPTLWRIPVLAIIPSNQPVGESVWDLDTDDFLCKRHPLPDLKRRVEHLLGMATYYERERILQDEASRDYLTGLLNRRGFYTSIDALRQSDLPLALYLFDLDNLKKVNDQYGHEAGDAMLRYFSEVLQQNTRKGDILCRYGGDEFMVILRCINSDEVVLKKGQKICKDFNQYQFEDGSRASCSGGIVMCGDDQKPTSEHIERADKSLYKAKREKKGNCCMWKK